RYRWDEMQSCLVRRQAGFAPPRGLPSLRQQGLHPAGRPRERVCPGGRHRQRNKIGQNTGGSLGGTGARVERQGPPPDPPQVVDGLSLARLLGIKRVVLLNDLEATGYSIAHLSASELCGLNDGKPEPRANRALIAAGTGLGEAILFWDGSRHVVAATEGGHTD